jgi:hypothetical protein
MRQVFLLIFTASVCIGINGQTVVENLSGKVSFISSQSVYVKFKSTQGISVGDTLYIPADDRLVPVLLVKNLSSTSCVCTNISAEILSPDHLMIAKIKIGITKPEEKVPEKVITETPVKVMPVDSAKINKVPEGLKQNIKGSVSVNSYTDLSNTGAANSQRYRYTLSFDARNIANSKLSVETYVSFKHKAGDWAEVKSNIFNALKIYSLSVSYDPGKATHISLGRRINPRISSIGSSDGLQVEKSFGKFTIGAIAGLRPDFTNYGFDPKLLQYGGYVSLDTKATGNYTETSLAFMQQMNNSKTDRRFLYFQHSNTFLKNINFLSTFEVDLFKLENDVPKSTFNLTGVYMSMRYKMTKSFTISGSYDARKNVMYYETYKTFIDHLLETELRQGYRVQANYRISKNMIVGLQSGYRFLKADPHPSKNLYGYFTWSQISGQNISATLSGTYIESNYLNGETVGVNINSDLSKGKVQVGAGYHLMNYKLPESQITLLQHVGELNLSAQLGWNMSFSVNYEGTFEKSDKYSRVYFQLRKRF